MKEKKKKEKKKKKKKEKKKDKEDDMDAEFDKALARSGLLKKEPVSQTNGGGPANTSKSWLGLDGWLVVLGLTAL